jgi:L-aspartate oxidase
MNNEPVIVGAGVAGLMAALCMAPRPVILLCAGKFGSGTASAWAQGGIAAAIGEDDSAALHAADTVAAGAALCDADVVARIIEAGPWAIETLLRLGARFGRDVDARIELGLEAAHGRRRIVHAADATGGEIMRVLVAAVRATPSITVIENAQVNEIVARDNTVQGVHSVTANGMLSIPACFVIMATGGVGGLFAYTTNPLHAVGSGLALAASAGAALRDMEFVQFHPTALNVGLDPMPLVSEAVRGEGAVFVDADFVPFMEGRDLAARDIVARAVASKYAEGRSVFLDARAVPERKFPGMFAACRANGIDPAVQPVPVAPAAHYHMGGIAVDAACESSVRGLFACGEVAATGLHGANRLASNSLLEAMATGRIVAEACAGRTTQRVPGLPAARERAGSEVLLPEIRRLCSKHLGILRNAEGLTALMSRLRPMVESSDAALVAALIAHAAGRRCESRGAHFRTDFPMAEAAFAKPLTTHISELSAMRLAA